MSSLPARLEVVDEKGRPTRPFIALWTASGALVGLPAAMVLIDRAGVATAAFSALLKAAFPTAVLNPRDRIVVARRPTLRFLALWAKSTA